MVDHKTNDFMKNNLPKVVAQAIRRERQRVKDDIATMVTNDVANIVPPHVDSFLRNYMSNHNLNVHPTSSASSSIPDLQHQLYLKMKDDEQAQQADISIWLSLKIKFERPTPLVVPCRVADVHTRDHEDHHDDDARPEGRAMRKDRRLLSTQEEPEDFDAWLDEQDIDDEEVPNEEVSPELLAKVSEREMTSNDIQRMQNAINIMMRDRCN
ncbi:hypothetical protein Tco_0488400 [Tanacetum coccineum]